MACIDRLGRSQRWHVPGGTGRKHGKLTWQGLVQGMSVEEQGYVLPTLGLPFHFPEPRTKTKPSPGQAGSGWDAGSSKRCSSLKVLVQGAIPGPSTGTASVLVPSTHVSAGKGERPVGGSCFCGTLHSQEAAMSHWLALSHTQTYTQKKSQEKLDKAHFVLSYFYLPQPCIELRTAQFGETTRAFCMHVCPWLWPSRFLWDSWWQDPVLASPSHFNSRTVSWRCLTGRCGDTYMC